MGTQTNSIVRTLRKPFYLEDTLSFAPAFALEPSGHEMLRYFAEVASSRLGEVRAQLGGQDNPNVLRDLERAVGADEKGKSAAEIILDMLMEASKVPGSGRVGRPLDSYQEFAWLYADVQFLKAKTRMSERKICEVLANEKRYHERYKGKKASALRAKLLEARKLPLSDWKFEVFLCGPDAPSRFLLSIGAPSSNQHFDYDGAAIERHALKW
jgi:hypothetical protein